MMFGVELGAEHGKKRPHPDDDVEGEQRLTKRFDRLHLDHRQYVSRLSPTSSSAVPIPQPVSRPVEEHMHLDDTKNKIYIHDLDAELAEIEEEDKPKIEFHPDIEKKLRLFPSFLETRTQSPPEGQLILYKPISFPEEVRNERRKAIIEARRKAREAQSLENNMKKESKDQIDQIDQGITNPDAIAPTPNDNDDDPDAMEIG